MKKILILLLLCSFTILAVEYPEYVTEVKKIEFEKADYNAKILLESSMTNDGTLGMSIVRVAHTLKHMQEEFPNANWFFFQTYTEDGSELWTGSFKNKVDLQNKKDNVALVGAVFENLNIYMNPQDRQKIKQFIEEGYIPMF